MKNATHRINPEFDDNGFTPKMIVNHANELTRVERIDHRSIMDRILSAIEPIDFVSRVGVEDQSKLTRDDYCIVTSEEILKITRANGWGLCQNQGFIYGFNGCYWSLIEEGDLKTFLSKAAEKLGVTWRKARSANFEDYLFKQFLKTARLPSRERKEEILIPLLNGTFEIKNGQRRLKPFDMDDFITYQLPFEYDPDAKAPLFEKFLNEVLPDASRQMVLAEFLGYVFTVGLKLEKTLMPYGSGANGKSVFFEIVNALLGPENVSTFSITSLTDKSGYYRAMLANKLLNYASEINGDLEASIFKQIVSGEPVEARLPHGKPMIIRDYAKIMFNTNVLPHNIEHTDAFFRRFLIVPFDVTIKPENQDPELAKKIIANELPGVFNWVLAGLDRILTNRRFSDCDAVIKQVEEFRKQSDSVALFLEDTGYQKAVNHYTYLKELYNEYRTYCFESGCKVPALRTFSDRLRNLGFQIEKRNAGRIVYISK